MVTVGKVENLQFLDFIFVELHGSVKCKSNLILVTPKLLFQKTKTYNLFELLGFENFVSDDTDSLSQRIDVRTAFEE